MVTSGNQAGLDVKAGTGSVLAAEAKSGGGADAAGVGAHARPSGGGRDDGRLRWAGSPLEQLRVSAVAGHGRK